MRKLKISLITLVIFIFLGVSVHAAEYGNFDKRELFENLDIPIEGYEDEYVTRAQMADVVAHLYDVYDMYNPQHSYFSDVEENNLYYKSINFLYDLGIINGVGNGEFKPDDVIMPEQAAVIIVKALGYDIAVKDGAYLPKAYELKAFKGISLDSNGIRVKDLVEILYNMLEIPVMEINFSNGYSVSDELFSDAALGIYKIEGVVSDNGVISFEGDTKREGHVVVDGLSIEATGFESLLGNEVECWFRIVDDSPVCVYAGKIETDDTCYIESYNIDDYKDFTYTYTENEFSTKEKRARIENNYILIYNGYVFDPSYGSAIPYMIPQEGDVTLVDSDSNGIYDVVIINNYKTALVSRVDIDNEIIYLSDNDQCDLSDVIYSIKDIDGSEIELNSIKKDDCVMVAKSMGGENYNIVCSSQTFTGTVSSMTDDYYTISDVDYRVSYSAELDIKLSESYTFTINAKGYLFKAVSDSQTQNFVYLDGVFIDNEHLDKKFIVRYMDSKGKIFKEEYEKIITDTGRYKASETDVSLLNNELSGKLFILTKYANASVKFKEISKSPYTQTAQTMLYRNSPQGFNNGNIAISNNTMVFLINDDFEKSAVLTKSFFSHGFSYDIVAYNSNIENLYCDVIVIENNDNGESKLSTLAARPALVIDERVALNADDEAVRKYTLYQEGTEKQILMETEQPSTYTFGPDSYTVSEGDTIIYSEDLSGTTTAIAILYDNESDKFLYKDEFCAQNINAGKYVRLGYVYRMTNDYIQIYTGNETDLSLVEDGDADLIIMPLSSFKIALYDTQWRNSFQSATTDDIAAYKNGGIGDKVLISLQEGQGRMIIIYR